MQEEILFSVKAQVCQSTQIFFYHYYFSCKLNLKELAQDGPLTFFQLPKYCSVAFKTLQFHFCLKLLLNTSNSNMFFFFCPLSGKLYLNTITLICYQLNSFSDIVIKTRYLFNSDISSYRFLYFT